MVIRIGDKFVIKEDVCLEHDRPDLICEVFTVGKMFHSVNGRYYVCPDSNNNLLNIRAIDVENIEILDEVIPFSENEIGVLLGI